MATEDDVNQNKPYLTKKAQNLKMKSLKMQTAEMTIRPNYFNLTERKGIKMDNNLVKPRHIDGCVGLSALAPYHSSLFFEWLNNPRIFKGMGDFDSNPFGFQDSEKYVNVHLKDTWLIVFKKQAKWIPVGYTGLFVRQRHRVGILRYAIGNQSYEKMWITTKAVNLMIKWAFNDLDLVCIHASVISLNNGSIRVLEKSGFSHVGKYQKARFESGKRYDELLFELVKEMIMI